ncbi:hypothetical protein MKW98_024665 [Papaver atlanticum]|uniref:Uncharacterized protein n=1 Tax=Papaver atlanticum TaxID=357466 RepID=A0AAD4X7Q6_9MAGN|nr:hypothetical protein MKW98_024665 [Papaver atlanticum]
MFLFTFFGSMELKWLNKEQQQQQHIHGTLATTTDSNTSRKLLIHRIKLGNLWVVLLFLAHSATNRIITAKDHASTTVTALSGRDLSSNNFSGQVPFSVADLEHLLTLILTNNSFQGEIPSQLTW